MKYGLLLCWSIGGSMLQEYDAEALACGRGGGV